MRSPTRLLGCTLAVTSVDCDDVGPTYCDTADAAVLLPAPGDSIELRLFGCRDGVDLPYVEVEVEPAQVEIRTTDASGTPRTWPGIVMFYDPAGICETGVTLTIARTDALEGPLTAAVRAFGDEGSEGSCELRFEVVQQ
jgi:hypothetical protein